MSLLISRREYKTYQRNGYQVVIGIERADDDGFGETSGSYSQNSCNEHEPSQDLNDWSIVVVHSMRLGMSF